MIAPQTDEARLEVEAHTWRLRDVEFEDAATTRCFECIACGTVRYE